MSKNRALGLVFSAALLGAGLVLAQDRKETKPLDEEKPLLVSKLQVECERALASKAYLRDLKIACREEGTGRVFCEGTVPTKAHACAVFLTCMSIPDVALADISRLRIEHWGAETTKPKEKPKKLSLYAVVLNPEERGVTTTPGGTRVFQNDIIVIGDVPTNAIPKESKEYLLPDTDSGAPRSNR